MSKELNPNYNVPNGFGQRCLKWSLPANIKEAVMGDLVETFHQKNAEFGDSHAQRWYLRQALLTTFIYLKRTQKGPLMFILSLLVFATVIVMAFLLSGDYRMFVNIPSLLIVLPPAMFFAVAATSMKALKDGFKVMNNDQIAMGKIELLTSKRAFVTLGNTAMLAGWLGVVIGIVAIASNVEPEIFPDVIGSATAICMLTLVYGMLLKIPCYLIEQKLLHKLEVMELS